MGQPGRSGRRGDRGVVLGDAPRHRVPRRARLGTRGHRELCDTGGIPPQERRLPVRVRHRSVGARRHRRIRLPDPRQGAQPEGIAGNERLNPRPPGTRLHRRGMTPGSLAVALAFVAIGAAAERLASVWPSDEASRRPPGGRTVLLALAAGLAGGALAWRSTLPTWALGVHLLILAMLVVLTATDLEQRRLPHL